MKTADIRLGNWLGTFENRHRDPRNEHFPDGQLNHRQLRAILSLDDPKYGRVDNVGPSFQPIVRLTDNSIIECDLNLSKGSFSSRRACKLWLSATGKMIASAVWIGTTHDDHTVESYWTKPEDLDFRGFGYEPITKQHEYGMWSLGMDGAVPLTRQFIKEHYAVSHAA